MYNITVNSAWHTLSIYHYWHKQETGKNECYQWLKDSNELSTTPLMIR